MSSLHSHLVSACRCQTSRENILAPPLCLCWIHYCLVQKVQTTLIMQNIGQVSPPPSHKITTLSTFTNLQTFLGQNHHSTTKVTPNEPPIIVLCRGEVRRSQVTIFLFSYRTYGSWLAWVLPISFDLTIHDNASPWTLQITQWYCTPIFETSCHQQTLFPPIPNFENYLITVNIYRRQQFLNRLRLFT